MNKQIKAWDDELPDPSSWGPRTPSGAENLRQGLQLTCRVAEHRIAAEAEAERRFNIDNFDSGPAVEDLVRRELRRLLPTRYEVLPGVVNDATGGTAGDCDLIIANRQWAPFVKLGATEESRRQHVPIESVYSLLEVKQSGTFSALDDAMQKLVSANRLKRAHNPYGHITENQHLSFLDKESLILNPLFSVVFMARPNPSMPFEDLAKRFFRVNSLVASSAGRDGLVTMLCVLGGGVGAMVTSGVWEEVGRVAYPVD